MTPLQFEGLYQADGVVFCDEHGQWLLKKDFMRQAYRRWQKAAGIPLRR